VRADDVEQARAESSGPSGGACRHAPGSSVLTELVGSPAAAPGARCVTCSALAAAQGLGGGLGTAEERPSSGSATRSSGTDQAPHATAPWLPWWCPPASAGRARAIPSRSASLLPFLSSVVVGDDAQGAWARAYRSFRTALYLALKRPNATVPSALLSPAAGKRTVNDDPICHRVPLRSASRQSKKMQSFSDENKSKIAVSKLELIHASPPALNQQRQHLMHALASTTNPTREHYPQFNITLLYPTP
jgi:hypothetical protein